MEASAHGRGEVGVIEVEDVLHDVVAEWVLHKVEAVRSDLTHKLDLLKAGRVIDAALENTATMAVRTNRDAVLANRIKDELCLQRLEVVQALLNNMVAVEVLDEVDDLARQSLDDHLGL